MIQRIRAVFTAEPVRVVQSVLAVAVAFGLAFTGAQVEAIVAAVAVILGGEVSRRRVSPV